MRLYYHGAVTEPLISIYLSIYLHWIVSSFLCTLHPVCWLYNPLRLRKAGGWYFIDLFSVTPFLSPIHSNVLHTVGVKVEFLWVTHKGCEINDACKAFMHSCFNKTWALQQLTDCISAWNTINKLWQGSYFRLRLKYIQTR